MFCGNCGKEITGFTKFCHYCGAEQTATVVQAAPEAAATAPADNAAKSAPISAPASAPVSQSAAVPSIVSAPGLPTPNVIPTNNLSAAAPTVVKVPENPAARGVTSAAVTIEDNEEKPRPERKYSLKHIVMCLTAAAVMAVAAGVFAGLYFSVI